MNHQYSLEGRELITYGYRERAETGSSSGDSNRLFKIPKRRSLVAKSWYTVKKVAVKLDGSSMSIMTRETRPSRFPADTVPSVAGRSKHSESLAAISIKPRITGLIGSQLRVWGKSIDKVADRVGRGAAILEFFLVGVVLVLFGEGGLAGGAPGSNEEVLLLDLRGSDVSLLTPGDVSRVV